jgi:hypothetical protein
MERDVNVEPARPILIYSVVGGGAAASIYKKLKRYAGTKRELSFFYTIDTERLKYVLLDMFAVIVSILLVYTFIQEHFATGVMLDSVKG